MHARLHLSSYVFFSICTSSSSIGKRQEVRRLDRRQDPIDLGQEGDVPIVIRELASVAQRPLNPSGHQTTFDVNASLGLAGVEH